MYAGADGIAAMVDVGGIWVVVGMGEYVMVGRGKRVSVGDGGIVTTDAEGDGVQAMRSKTKKRSRVKG